MATILVINSGSSSLKYQLIRLTADSGERLAKGLIERIGESAANISHSGGDNNYQKSVAIADFSAAMREMEQAFAATGMPLAELNLTAVGHRVVQGGSRFTEPTVITPEVVQEITALSPLAPLHNPGHVAAITAALEIFKVPHIAVFDTAFHQTMPAAAYTYAIAADVAKEQQIRRYGFHGTSHQYVSRAAAEFLQRPLPDLRQIILHLGNGASACAVAGGVSINTSMGLTPLEGLVMGTRSGDVDPSIIFYLQRQAGMSAEAVDELLNKRSGVFGISGSADMRDVAERAAAGDAAAELALQIYAKRVRHYIGAYTIDLGGLDTLVFTAGVGENNAPARAAICAGLEPFGIVLDPELNALPNTGPRIISTAASRVQILVVPTNEELEIARLTQKALG